MKSKILKIAGDASFRTFYRIISKKKSRIIVIAKRKKYENLIAYLAVNKFLKDNKIFVPKLYSHDFSKGIIIIEDFGDLTFHSLILKKKNKFVIYKQLTNLLLKIQKIKPQFKIKKINSGFHTMNKYSNKHLFRESNLFFDWYLTLFLSKKKSLKIKNRSKKILSKLYNRLSFSNSCFVHRDFHAQNLMKVGRKIGVIDSQDAIIGNPAYDLVSLIDDVRIKTSEELKKQIYNYYINKSSKVSKSNSNKFLQDYNILSVQRTLKIIGIFSRLYIRDNKKRYLKFIPYAWKLLELRMNSKIFSDLKKLLNENISKKKRKKVIKK